MAVSNKLAQLVTGIVFVFFGFAMIPVVADFITGLNTTSVAALTGGAGLVTLIQFFPFIFGAGVILGGLVIIWAVTRGG